MIAQSGVELLVLDVGKLVVVDSYKLASSCFNSLVEGVKGLIFSGCVAKSPGRMLRNT